MITKAIIELKVDLYSYRVRIPFINKSKYDPLATKLLDLYIARVILLPGVDVNYAIDDIVYLDFESDEFDLPVILGLLAKSSGYNSTSHIVLNDEETSYDLIIRTINNRLDIVEYRGYSNTNLLINPFFTVNLRGLSSYTLSNEYGFDCWKGMRGYNPTKIVVEEVDNGIKLSCSGGSNFPFIMQTIESPERFAGKAITFSANIKEFSLYRDNDELGNKRPSICRILIGVIVPDGNSTKELYYTSRLNVGITSVTTVVPNDVKGISCRIIVNNSANDDATGVHIIFNGTKLEIGESSTLEYDVAPEYTTELLKCLRYFQHILITGYPIDTKSAYGWQNTDLSNRVSFSLPVAMRTRPSLHSCTGTVYGDTSKLNNYTQLFTANYKANGYSNGLITLSNLGGVVNPMVASLDIKLTAEM